ncbi:MAG TPA: HNH endonuclease signature motif containing protein, partial [Polyangiaceae bacterium]
SGLRDSGLRDGGLCDGDPHVGAAGDALKHQDLGDEEPASRTAQAGQISRRPRTTRATQTIPPSIRRKVVRRDGGRCRVPGCRHAVFVDAHHIHPGAVGGRHDPDNLVTLCAAHHRAVHRGELVIEGPASGTLTFRHSDGTRYGSPQVSASAADVFAKAFQALREQGFREGEIRRVLASADVRNGTELAKVFRAALLELTPARVERREH